MSSSRGPHSSLTAASATSDSQSCSTESTPVNRRAYAAHFRWAPAVDHRSQQRSWPGFLEPGVFWVNIDRALTDADIARAVPGKRSWLNEQRRLGKTICSVITDARLAALGVKVAEDFSPSVPFVATASAAWWLQKPSRR